MKASVLGHVSVRDGGHIDPVCGMTVSGDSELHAEHAGHTYFFCGEHCLQKFAQNPMAYVGKQADGGDSHRHTAGSVESESC